MGNYHARFLGGWARATAPGYPPTRFSQVEFEGKKRLTRRERFLDEMENIMPWADLLAMIEPHYPKEARGRPPIA